jgi:hypothetical protein
MSSRVLYSLRSLIASSWHTFARVALVPAVPGERRDSFSNCRQLTIRAYKVAGEKCWARISCCIGLTRNCDICGDLSCSQDKAVSVRSWTRLRMACVML